MARGAGHWHPVGRFQPAGSAAQSSARFGVATKFHGQEGKILRFVFWHSLVLAVLIGLWVAAQAYWPPLQGTVVR